MGKKIEVPVGSQFGYWTVTGEPVKVRNRPFFLFFFVCGKEKLISAVTLRNGSSKSCGCMRSEILKEKFQTVDFNTYPMRPGLQFGNWTVIGRAVLKNKRHYSHCRCVCGTERDVLNINLRSGRSASCGCRVKKQPE